MTYKLTGSIYICGMMGSGKTTVGKILAGKLKLPFIDLDEVIVKKAGNPIPEIFRTGGEHIFRKLEKDALYQTVENSQKIIALGGGALQNQEIVNHIKKKSLLIFLDAPLSVLSKRLANDSGRPLLQNTDEKETEMKIAKLLSERTKYYSQAHIKIETEKYSPELIADKIIRKLQSL